MPLYEYQCDKCGSVFELIQKFSDEPITVHEEGGCGGPVRRLLSPPALQFKGSGWYITDYAKGGSSKGDSSSSKSGSSGSESKTSDTKSSSSDSSSSATTSASSTGSSSSSSSTAKS